MKPILLVAAATLAAVPLLSSAGESSMKFWSRGQEAGDAVHQLLPYRIENRMMVVVHDPVVCGQVPDRPRFSIEKNQLTLQYDLTAAPTGEHERPCVAYSLFQIDNLPDRSLEVRFAGGPEPFSVAQLKRCPSQSPRSDKWDCLVPRKLETAD